MISLLSKFRRPTGVEYGEPSREIGIDEPRRTDIISQKPCAHATSTASCGVRLAETKASRGWSRVYTELDFAQSPYPDPIGARPTIRNTAPCVYGHLFGWAMPGGLAVYDKKEMR